MSKHYNYDDYNAAGAFEGWKNDVQTDFKIGLVISILTALLLIPVGVTLARCNFFSNHSNRGERTSLIGHSENVATTPDESMSLS